MNMKLHEWIKNTIDKTPGLTQKGLAEATGLNPATVNRMLYGRRHIRAEEVPLIEKYLGCKYETKSDNTGDYIQPVKSSNRAFSDVVTAQNFIAKPNIQADIPVYQSSDNGKSDSLLINQSQIVDWIERHPKQNGNDNAFAIYIATNKFEPRYYMGELVYIHAGRPPIISQDCLVKKLDDDVVLARYKGQDSTYVYLTSLKDNKDINIATKDIVTTYLVVGRG